MCVYVYKYVYMYTYMCMCIYIYIYTHIHTCIYTRVYAYIYIYIYIYLHIRCRRVGRRKNCEPRPCRAQQGALEPRGYVSSSARLAHRESSELERHPRTALSEEEVEPRDPVLRQGSSNLGEMCAYVYIYIYIYIYILL